MRDLLAKIALLVVATAVTLVGMEYTLRCLGFRPMTIDANDHFRPDTKYGWAQFDPVLGWRNKPGISASNEEGNASMTFWSDGRRLTRSDPSPKPLPQVLFVGCSWMQGYGVTDEETFAYRLSQMNPKWDVEDFGTGGYGAYQSLLRLRRIFSEKTYSPKLVVYGYVNFHAYRDVAGYFWVKKLQKLNGEFFAPPSVTVEQGHLVEHLPITFASWPLETSSVLVGLAKNAYLRLRFLDREDSAEEATKLLLMEMRDLVVENGAHFLVMELTLTPTVIQDYMNAHAIDSVDCLRFDPTVRVENPSYQIGGVGHPNQKVHEIWAACIDHWLEGHEALARQATP
jgi:hypothetical protein